MSRENELREYRSVEFGGLVPSALDWARLAAFVDGEGSILMNSHTATGRRITPGWYLRVTVANTDVRLMMWLKETFGGTFKDANTEKYYEGKNWKRTYHWGAGSTRGAWVLANCLPYFIIKREQAEIGLQLQDSLRETRTQKRNGLPPGVVEFRKVLKGRLTTLKAKGRSQDFERSESSTSESVVSA